jgi:hypothetical protein
MKKIDIIFFVLVIACILGVIYMAHLMKSETAKCIQNPFIYGASNMKGVSCSCSQAIKGNCLASFYFNDTAFKSEETKCISQYP